MKQENDITFITWMRKIFKKDVHVSIGDIGIFHYVWTCDTLHEDSHGLKYDVYAKVKAVDVYYELVEVEVLDIKINDSASIEVNNIIKNNFPKYIHPKSVKWKIKEKSIFNGNLIDAK